MSKRPMTRRTFLKRSLFGLTALLGGAIWTGYHAYAQAPFRWQSKTIEVSVPQLPNVWNGLRIFHFSDTHFGFHYNLSDFDEIANHVMQAQADLIVFTGDLLHPDCTELEAIGEQFKTFSAPLGKFAVLGNHDYFYGRQSIIDLMNRSGFEVLVNSHQELSYNGQSLLIAGVDDQTYGEPNIERTLADVKPSLLNAGESFRLLLSHSPDYADVAKNTPMHLQLSGHSHGGQVRLPWIGHLIAPLHGRKYVDGLYSWKDSGMQLFTNRGIGTSRLPLRLLCPPEVNLIIIRS